MNNKPDDKTLDEVLKNIEKQKLENAAAIKIQIEADKEAKRKEKEEKNDRAFHHFYHNPGKAISVSRIQ